MSDWGINSFSNRWLNLVQRLLQAPSTSPRGLGARELVACQTMIDMQYPVINLASRKTGYRFMPGEAYWILDGDNRVSTIAPYGDIAKFSDDGETFFGAYGPRIAAQWGSLCDRLINDPLTRQAVINIWRENPPQSKDIPCTISVQWFLRPALNEQQLNPDRPIYYLHCIDTMRSSDVWLGLPYDVFNFTMLTIKLALRLQGVMPWKIKLGKLFMNCGSQHLYDKNVEDAKHALTDLTPAFNLAPFGAMSVDKWKNETELMNWLNLARMGGLDKLMEGEEHVFKAD